MANVISDETIEYVGILAKLMLSDEEKEQAKKDMGSMLDYIDKLGELDTTDVEPMSHVFPVNNVFREDVVTNGDDRDNIIANAPEEKDKIVQLLLDSSKHFIKNRTGISEDEKLDKYEDLTIALLCLCSDMYDRRQFMLDSNSGVPLNVIVESILNMHSFNLL